MSSHPRHQEENPRAEEYSSDVRCIRYTSEQGVVEGGPKRGWSDVDCSLLELCRSARAPSIHVVFLETPPESEQTLRTLLTQTYGISEDFWSELYQEANGYFGAYPFRDDEGVLQSYKTEFRYLCKCNKRKAKAPTKQNSGISYVWEKMAFFTSWQSDGSFVMLCFDLPELLQSSVKTRMKKTMIGAVCGPFLAHPVVVEAMVQDYEAATWEWRDLVREIEQMRPRHDELASFKADYIKMHELSRHTVHNTENLASAIETTATILDTLRRFDGVSNLADQRWSNEASECGLVRQHSMLKSLHNRSQAVESRLSSEISLVFHINGQQDSKFAADIAKLSREDSEVTKTIAVLGLVFLPGTLVSAIFSTSFFNFVQATNDTPARWAVSDQFWIYWVVTALLTVLTLATWAVWRRWADIQARLSNARAHFTSRRRSSDSLPMTVMHPKSSP